jgi:hypothetical protein
MEITITESELTYLLLGILLGLQIGLLITIKKTK